MNVSDVSQSRRRKENCTERYAKGLMNQNGKYLMNLRELNILQINTESYSLCFVYNSKSQNFWNYKSHKD